MTTTHRKVAGVSLGTNSNLATYGLLAALVAFALAGVLLIQPGPESTQRLGLFFGVVGTAVAAVVALIKSDQAAHNTNGSLDERIEQALLRAQNTRRKSDITPDSAAKD